VAEDEAFSIQKAREIWIAKGGDTRGKKARQKKRQKIAGTVDKRSLRATGRTEQFNFRTDPETAGRIREAAASADMSIVDWMEEAVVAYLAKPGGDSNA
jgi:hypothetical protein